MFFRFAIKLIGSAYKHMRPFSVHVWQAKSPGTLGWLRRPQRNGGLSYSPPSLPYVLLRPLSVQLTGTIPARYITYSPSAGHEMGLLANRLNLSAPWLQGHSTLGPKEILFLFYFKAGIAGRRDRRRRHITYNSNHSQRGGAMLPVPRALWWRRCL